MDLSTLSRRGLLVLPAFCWLIGCAATEPAVPLQIDMTIQDWKFGSTTGKHVQTEHFDIYTTLRDDEFIDMLPLFFESAYHQYTGLIPPRVDDPPRMTTYLFSTRMEWDAFVRRKWPSRAPIYRRIQSGAFTEETTSVAYYIDRVRTLSVLAHEGFHQYAATHLASDLPAWLNEGLATYCESFEFQDGVPTFVPRRNAGRRRSLQEAFNAKTLLPLRDVLRTHAGEVIVATDRRVYSYYAQAWGLIAFLIENPTYGPGFQELLEAVGSRDYRIGIGAYVAASNPVDGKPINAAEAAFRKYIAEDVDGFESEYTEYLRTVAFGS